MKLALAGLKWLGTDSLLVGKGDICFGNLVKLIWVYYLSCTFACTMYIVGLCCVDIINSDFV